MISANIKFNRVSISETLGAINPESVFPSDRFPTEMEYECIQRTKGHLHGDFSHVFHFQDEDSYDFSIDLPFYGGWHELTSCYLGTGWQLESRIVSENAAGDFVEANFVTESGLRGFLLFSLVDTEGRAVSSRPSSLMPTWSWFELKRRALGGMTGELVQFQLWCPTEDSIDDASKIRFRKRFLELRESASKALLMRKHD